MDFYLQEESGYAFTVLEMPFLDDIEPFDKKAVEALNELQWHSVTRLATNFNLFWYVVEHEALSDGIEDDDVLKISVLDEFAVGVRRSDHAQFDASAILEGLDDILLPGAIEIEEGFVQLPNDRRATVRIFRPEAISLAPGTMSEPNRPTGMTISHSLTSHWMKPITQSSRLPDGAMRMPGASP